MFIHDFVAVPKMIQQTQDDGVRRYITPKGHAYESVTTFISRNWDKKGLVKWQKRLGVVAAEKERVRTATRGKSLHSGIESYLMNEKVVFDDPVRKSVFLNIKSALSRINNIRLLEKPLYSDELKLAGTPDAISDFDDDLAVIDFKTSNKIKKRIWIVHHFLQAACYAVMYNEHFKTMPQKAVIIMAVENERQPVVYIEPMRGCILALREFIKDPIQFQKDVLKG